jgi:hypothetical protein
LLGGLAGAALYDFGIRRYLRRDVALNVSAEIATNEENS